ncbi:hypothetical protein Tsubulata_019983 [Turnera subulata]|uniref:Uncharacterized protein n=1 Tax=Turnera subulata TaxID=218843 RepID=A0A9Q0GC40_9ROSI|nr:hypothetical protein Tsubulata_019983 [Turnera subulata]
MSSNLITYLIGPLGQSTAGAAKALNVWSGTATLLPLMGAFVADSFLGRFKTIVVASLGLALLTLLAVLPFSADSDYRSTDDVGRPASTSSLQVFLFLFALYVVALGVGGHKPCVQAFGADQFDGEDTQECKARSSFFNWWYFGMNAGTSVSTVALSYMEENFSWSLGFGIPCIMMLVALVIFFLGTRSYRYSVRVEGKGPFVRIGRVFLATIKNWKAAPFIAVSQEEACGLALHHRSTEQFRFLNKALLLADGSLENEEACSVSEVEEARTVLRLVPIWTSCLVCGIVLAQPSTFFTKQGATMDRLITTNFEIPAASLQSLMYVAIILFIPIYDRILVPTARVLTGKSSGITTLQRIGTGMVLSILLLSFAALVETKRLMTAKEYGLVEKPDVTIPMSIWWLVPQYVLFGITDAFIMVGLQEFFYNQVPSELRSIGLALYLSIFGVGSFLSSFLISAIEKATGGAGHDSWFTDNLNRAHLDYFYWLLAGLSAAQLYSTQNQAILLNPSPHSQGLDEEGRVEVAERSAYVGMSSNLITYLTGPLGQSTAGAAKALNVWSGTAAFLPMLGAFVADSFLGRFKTIVLSSLVYILGLALLTLLAVLPYDSDYGSTNFVGLVSTSSLQIFLFLSALYVVALGQGGHKPCVQAFGADQFDGQEPQECKARSSFFNWWYFGMHAGMSVSTVGLSYMEENFSWGFGFGIPCIMMLVALVVFLLGTRSYRYSVRVEGKGPFVRIGRVFLATIRNWKTAPLIGVLQEETCGLALHHQNSEQFRFLNKALLLPDGSLENEKVCSVSEVEEAKTILRLVPIWISCLVYGIVFAQSSTFFTKQGATMDRSISTNFKIPAASLQFLISVAILLFIPVYDRILVPAARVLTGKSSGITTLQRIGTGMVLSIVLMSVAALVETKRLMTAKEYGLVDKPDVTIPMSIWWLIPQYVVFGITDAFIMVGLQEFFYNQVPSELRSIGLALYHSIFGVGSFLSSFLISAIEKATGGVGHDNWFTNNLNRAHLDYFYWLLAALSAAQLATSTNMAIVTNLSNGDGLSDQTHHPLLCDTIDGFVDHRGSPAQRSKTGGWKSALFIIGVEVAERSAFFGMTSNLITYLTGPLGQSTAGAAKALNVWAGTAALLPLLGAFVADSFLGRFKTIVVASLVYILGLALLTLLAVLPFSADSDYKSSNLVESVSTSSIQMFMFLFALYVVALGQGGHKPCVQAFGADQFDGEDPQECKARSSFFNWWYFGINAGMSVSLVGLSYMVENFSWGFGFGIPCILMLVALLVFLLGTKSYRYSFRVEERGAFVRIGRVFLATIRNWKTAPSIAALREEACVSALHHQCSEQFGFLNKALLLPEGSNMENEMVCSASEVEEAKTVLRLVPIWTTCLVYGIVVAQISTFFTKQGATLDRSIITNFEIPAASLQSLISVAIILFIPIYDRVLVPVARLLTGKSSGITMLQRIGTGMVLSTVLMASAALVETKRLVTAKEYGLVDKPDITIPMSIWWLVPQYVLIGITDAFIVVGLQEFFYNQVPSELKSIGAALFLSIFGVGMFLSSFLISAIEKATGAAGHDSWFTNNLNKAHLDYFYWLLAALSAAQFAVFLYCAKSYIYKS